MKKEDILNMSREDLLKEFKKNISTPLVSSYTINNCYNCNDCLFCMTMIDKQYCILNIQLTKEKYFSVLEKFKKGV